MSATLSAVEFWRNRRRHAHEIMQSYRAQIRRGRLSGNRREECDAWNLLGHWLRYCRTLKQQEWQAALTCSAAPTDARPLVVDACMGRVDCSPQWDPQPYDDDPPYYLEDLDEWDRTAHYFEQWWELSLDEADTLAFAD